MKPFTRDYLTVEEKSKNALLNEIIRPLETLSVVSEKGLIGLNLWQGWVRVPKKGESWEPKVERIRGVQNLDGDFHKVTITYVSPPNLLLGCIR